MAGLCVRSRGCSVLCVCLAHTLCRAERPNVPGPLTHIIHITVDSQKFVARISPLRLHRLWSSTSNASQIRSERHTGSISRPTLFQGINQGCRIPGRNSAVRAFSSPLSLVLPPPFTALHFFFFFSEDSSDYISVIISLRPSQPPLFGV